MHVVRGMKFESVSSLKKFTRNLLLESKNKPLVRGMLAFDFLEDLLKRHPNAQAKTGCGIAAFTCTDGFGKDDCQLRVERVDGSWEVVSWNKACEGRPRPPRQEASRPMREAVLPDVLAYLNAAEPQCARCGERSSLEVDHVKEFKKIQEEFLAKWAEFHRERAQFQLLCKGCHVDKTHRG